MQTDRGVRRVPVSSRSLTGEVCGVEFESALERDLMLKMTFGYELDWFQSQPVKIDYECAEGKKRHYTPDLLVVFVPDVNGVVRKPLLCEVKYREDLAKNWKDLRRKFRAAKSHCQEVGWSFEVFDEHRIRTQELVNIQFLWKYKAADHNYDYALVILAALKAARRPVPMVETVTKLFATDEQRGAAIWAWWCLVANRVIKVDLHAPLKRGSLFWLSDMGYR